jgi:DUF971 family protein
MQPIPVRIDRHSDAEMLLAWNTGEEFALSYSELRFQCPCANCVDENTGRRVILREQVAPGIKPTAAQLVGRYAVQVTWNDGHQTGMYHFDRLFELCRAAGRSLGKKLG